MTRPDQTRPDQTRPDQTRPDHDLKYALKSLKAFLKKHDRFHIIEAINRKRYDILFGKDRTKHNLKYYLHAKNKSEDERVPYIIRRVASNVGLFSYFLTILGGIAYADKNGYVPVVDMKNYANTYLDDREVRHVNSWEYYFEQPGGMTLDYAMSCGKYILGRDSVLHNFPYTINEEHIAYWRELCRKYIRFARPVTECLEEMMRKFAGRKILGVLVRGTDYAALKPKGHPIPPTAEQAISKAQEVMSGKNFDAVYLATEDKKILAKFQAAFGEKLLLPKADYIDYDYDRPDFLSSFTARRKDDKYLRGLEYLVSMIFLSKCPGFIASLTSGSAGVMLLSEGFEYLYVFDLGVYK